MVMSSLVFTGASQCAAVSVVDGVSVGIAPGEIVSHHHTYPQGEN